jgi:hypothetical protein
MTPPRPLGAAIGGRTPTPWAVRCGGLLEGYCCGLVYLTEEEYDAQLMAAFTTWRCPLCGAEADWDDWTYEKAMGGE